LGIVFSTAYSISVSAIGLLAKENFIIHLLVDVFQRGFCTSSNMNTNEGLALPALNAQ